jgi:UDP-N-acetylglucosamine diphosphorylase / glucose-1-phosphate thymidylyltransferase / UDP-N-acetylgalactosamine diphosphorylase / glucosamine-1-phosphate N-acetyltransferase / galactosamine-1-phosphate N-acetyltransferase
MLTPSDFFDLEGLDHRSLLDGRDRVWQILPDLPGYLAAWLGEHGARVLGSVAPGAHIGPDVHVAAGAVVEPGAFIGGPAVIGPGSEVRHGAYIAGTVLVGARCVVGHASEIKRTILLDEASVPHLAYVGDSILGRRVNLGAGSKLSNLPMPSLADALAGRAPSIRIEADGVTYDTGLGKLGAILGDDVQLGCNAVTNPGCLVGPRTLVYAGVSLPKGYYPPDRVIKLRQDLVTVERRR